MARNACYYPSLRAPRPSSKEIAIVGEIVRAAIGTAQPSRYHNERRRERRFPFPYPVRLTPLGDDEETLDDQSVMVIGKTITELGMDFYHLQPLPQRYVVMWLPCGHHKTVGTVLELHWCRFSGYGWYENGGKFLRLYA
jgi:hypothetical protein